MNQLNNFILEGTLVGNPEYKENAAGGQDVSRFVLAPNRTYKNAKGEKENEVSYFDVEALGLISKRINCVKAGQGMRIAGRMKQNRWIDKDGKTQSKSESEYMGELFRKKYGEAAHIDDKVIYDRKNPFGFSIAMSRRTFKKLFPENIKIRQDYEHTYRI